METLKEQTMQQLVEDVMTQQALTMDHLVKTLGLHRRTVTGFIEDLGKRRSQLDKLRRLSLALNRPANWLLRELQKRGLR